MPTSSNTIAALATGWGRSISALIRLSGPDVEDVLDAVLEPLAEHEHSLHGAGTPTVVHRVFRLRALRQFTTPSHLPVPCIVARYAQGRSYTGEPSAELILPGNPALLERVVAQLAALPGVREAGPGEFSARAYLNGRLSLEQAEGVAAMIAASTNEHLAAAARLLSGEGGRAYRDWADRVANLLALVEAGIDFTDQEDVVPITPRELAARIDALIAEITTTLGATTGREHRSGEPVAVLYGEPNAGKSTLFNALLGRRRAVVSDVAGTTRDALREPLDLSAEYPGTGEVMLIDLAGVDDAATHADVRDVEHDLHASHAQLDYEAQVRARREVADADVVIWCDPLGRFASAQEPSRLNARGVVIRVRTKADQVGRADLDDTVTVCALDGFNLATLRRAIADAAWGEQVSSGSRSGAALVPRHRRALATALLSLQAARRGIAEPFAHALTNVELVAGDLRSALDALEELAGRISPDDVIGRVFATFCVGK